MINDGHPLAFARGLADRLGFETKLSFSRYFYRPNSVFDERITFWVEAGDVSSDWLQAQINDLPNGWELAFNSILKDERGRTHHVGMIDFAESASVSAIRLSVRRFLGDEALRCLSIYDSGRSYHGYIEQLMIPREWREFLGRLLLMNEVSQPPVVDSRWVGHRLVGGYCALRWSMNTRWYKAMPSKI